MKRATTLTRPGARSLSKNLRGSNNLVFANARSKVELFTDLLSRMCASMNFPQEFFAHHGSLSRELRFDVEDQLKRGDRPLTVICTARWRWESTSAQ